MKKILLICFLIFISACSLVEYQCKIGRKQGDSCITQEVTRTFNGCNRLQIYQYLHSYFFDDFLEESDTLKKTSSGCLYEEFVITKYDNIQTNDDLVKIDYRNGNLLFISEERNLQPGEFCINLTYTGYTKRIIWDEVNTAFPQCLNEVRSAGGEVK